MDLGRAFLPHGGNISAWVVLHGFSVRSLDPLALWRREDKVSASAQFHPVDEVDVGGQDPKVPSSLLSRLQQGKHKTISIRRIWMAMVRRPSHGKPHGVLR